MYLVVVCLRRDLNGCLNRQGAQSASSIQVPR
jgi:hypothetical protein